MNKIMEILFGSLLIFTIVILLTNLFSINISEESSKITPTLTYGQQITVFGIHYYNCTVSAPPEGDVVTRDTLCYYGIAPANLIVDILNGTIPQLIEPTPQLEFGT